MRQNKRRHVALLALLGALLFGAAPATPALAAAPQALSPADAEHYAAAFDAVDRGDYIDAAMQAVDISDPTLAGYITYRQLMHPTAHKSNYDELADWLSRYADLPVAERIWAMAGKRKSLDAVPTATPILSGLDWSKTVLVTPGTGGPFDLDNARLAREAFYSGDSRRALELAVAVGDRWIAGMAAYRLKKFELSEKSLASLAQDTAEDPWVRAGGAFWAARAAAAAGADDRAATYLRQAAGAPQTFYGMIAARQVALRGLGEPLPLIETAPQPRQTGLIRASYSAPTGDLDRMIRTDPRAHRAAALAQIGRTLEAGDELRAGLALARTPEDRDHWTRLAGLLNAALADEAVAAEPARRRADGAYPTPTLNPRSGFKIHKALVYAIVRQESRFNPGVVSRAGAIGLMQLMPDAAAHMSGNASFRDDASALFDPSLNLKLGQDYVEWLMSQGASQNHDLLRTVAAYNGGPGTLQKTAQMLGDDDDSLMVIACMPAPETRAYVEKVMAAYWTYRRKFGQDVKTLDALAQGEKYADARWDEEPAPVKARHGRKGRHTRRA
jgi:soluble lytic murein transglycosylase-like protein